MVSISQIAGSAKKIFTGKPASVLAKATGAATIASVLYDSHVNGHEKANSKQMLNSADRYFSNYKQYMKSDKESATIAKLKKIWFDMQPFEYAGVADRTGGYVSGFGETLVADLPFVGLAAAAIKFKKVGKVAALLLAAQGLKTGLYDIIGIGSKKEKISE